VVVGEQVGDQVVDHAAALVAAQRVLRLAGRDPGQIVAETGVHEIGRPRAPHPGLAEVRHIEDAGLRPDRGVFLDDTAARVLQWHLPAAELGELRPEVRVPVVKWGTQQHGSQLTRDPRGG
jgi:hypothetical protein